MPFSTAWKETVEPGEDAKFAAYAEEFVALQRDRNARYGAGRTLHRKPIGGVAAELTVRPDLAEVLPPELHVGPFTPGARYRAYVRFSNGSFDVHRDATEDVRGIAIKLLGVGGTKALTGTEEPRTHDFLLIQTPMTPVRNPHEFAAVVRAAAPASTLTLLPRLLWHLGPLTAARIARIAAAQAAPFTSFATARFFTASPYRFGPTAARYSLAPVVDQPAATTSTSRDRLADDLRQRLVGGLQWNLLVQFYQDENRTPIEDNSVDWDEQDAPYAIIARLSIPPTDASSDRAQSIAAYVEKLAFDPWHCPEVMRPIGAMNRARKAVYFVSTKGRETAPEPDDAEVP